MEFNLKYNKEANHDSAQKLVDILLDSDENAMGREAAAEVVHAYFKGVKKNAYYMFNHLVGSAARICAETPRHAEGCDCPTCNLHQALNLLIEFSEEVGDKEEKLARDWLLGLGREFSPRNAMRDNLVKELVPEVLKRILKDDEKTRKDGSY